MNYVFTNKYLVGNFDNLKTSVFKHNNDIIGPGSFHVTVYRQVIEEGMWRNAPSSLPAARELERRILLAAQELKIAAG